MRDVLVHASNYTTPTFGMRYAADVARALDGGLTALFVAEPIVPVTAPGIVPPIAPELYVAAAQVVTEALAAQPTFARWAQERGLKRHRWEVATGFAAAALAAAGNWHDALVLEAGTHAPWSSVGMLGHVLVSCGLPCFVVPQAYEGDARFDTIAIASHGSAEAVRTVHAALPLLQRAKRVVLLQGRPAAAFSPVEFRPPFTLQSELARHDIAFETRQLSAHDEQAGAAILDAAADVVADVIVMGAYGRTRFSEWVLGGATRHVLEWSRVPLFMRH